MLTNRGVFISAVTHNTRTSTHTFTHSRESLKSKNVTEMTNRGVLIYVIIHTHNAQNLTSNLSVMRVGLILILAVIEEKCITNFKMP